MWKSLKNKYLKIFFKFKLNRNLIKLYFRILTVLYKKKRKEGDEVMNMSNLNMNNKEMLKEETKIGIMVFDLQSEAEAWQIDVVFSFLKNVDFFIVGLNNLNNNIKEKKKENNQVQVLDKILKKIKEIANTKFYIFLRNENEENNEILKKLFEIKNIRLISNNYPVIEIIDNVKFKKILLIKPLSKRIFRYKYLSSNPELSLLYSIKKINTEPTNLLAIILFYNDYLFALNPRHISIPYVVVPSLSINSQVTDVLPGFSGFTKLKITKENIEIEIYNLNEFEKTINDVILKKLNKTEKKILKYLVQNQDSLVTLGKISHFTNVQKNKIPYIINNLNSKLNDNINFEIKNNDIVQTKFNRKIENLNLNNETTEVFVAIGCTHFGSILHPKIIKRLKEEIKTVNKLYVAGDVIENTKYITDLNEPEIEEQIKLAKKFFNKLQKINKKLEIVIIPGNHDAMIVDDLFKNYQKIINNRNLNLLYLGGIKLKTLKNKILQLIKNYDNLILQNIANNQNIKILKNPAIIDRKLIIHPHNISTKTTSLRLQEIIQTFAVYQKNFDIVIVANYHQIVSLTQKWGGKTFIAISLGTFKQKSKFEILKGIKIHDIGFWKLERKKYSIIFKPIFVKTNPF